jgi:Domain found in Dishevelled, Egl-10, and Pleckstrin (DEP)
MAILDTKAKAPRILLLLNDFEQTELLKAIGLSQGFEVRCYEHHQELPREIIKDMSDPAVTTLAVIELDFLHQAQVAPEVIANMITAANPKSRLLLSQSQQLVVRGAQSIWAKDQGAIGLIPSLSANRLHEQIAEHLAPMFALWGQTVNWARAQSFASMVPSGLGRNPLLKQTHRLLSELSGRSLAIKEIGAWARDGGGFKVTDMRWRLKTYSKCFVGSQAIEALMQFLNCDEGKAVQVGEQLRIAGFFNHVSYEHNFEAGDFFYRFYAPGEKVRRVRLNSFVKRICASDGFIVKDRFHNAQTYEQCFVGAEAVTWITSALDVNADEALQLGQYLLELGLIRHVANEHRFKNAELFYTFGGYAAKLSAKQTTSKAAGAIAPLKPATV